MLACCSEQAHHCEAAAEGFLAVCSLWQTTSSLYQNMACTGLCLPASARHAFPHTPCITALAKLGRFSQQAHHCEGVAERVQVHSAVCTAAPKACAKRWAVQAAAEQPITTIYIYTKYAI